LNSGRGLALPILKVSSRFTIVLLGSSSLDPRAGTLEKKQILGGVKPDHRFRADRPQR
jgi:hypothetical protein